MSSSYVSPFLSHAINHAWQSTVFVLAAWLVVLTLLRRNRPQVRYGVWLVASAKFLVPFAVLIDLGSHLGLMRLAAPRTQAGLYYAMDEVSRRVTPEFVPSALRPTIPAPGSPVPHLLLILWICGVAVVATSWMLRWFQIRAAVRRARPLLTAEGIPVLSSPALRERGLEPGVFGLLRPVILVPEGITDRLSPAQFESVLIHECCHARRHDNLIAALQMVIEALFWFHPLVWWLGRQMMQERERICDQEVLRRSNDPAVYAEGILNVCRFYVESPLRCVSGVTGSNLRRRIEEIMSPRVADRLNLAKKILLAAAALGAISGPLGIGLLNPPVGGAQTMSRFDGRVATAASKRFDVATVKANVSGRGGWRLGPPGHGSISIDNLQLRKIVASSFQIQDSLVFGPSWLDSTRYDIVGKGPDPKATNPEVWEMMRSLLAERFRLRYHIETRELPIYALVIAKGGPKLGKPEDGSCAESIRAGQTCGDILYPPFGVGIRNMPIGALVAALGRRMQERPIVNKTNLPGTWDATVRWMPDNITPEELAKIPEEQRPEEVSLFTALQQQLGLRLEAQKSPIEVVVIDGIERPSAN